MSDKDKLYFITGIKAILKAKQSSLEIIKRSKMSNLKLIERSSKSTKDPNPLATTIAQMNTKYPISIDKDLALKHGIPRDMFPKKDKEDKHVHGRIVCSLKAIEWWINKSAVPEENIIKVINILRKQLRADATKYFNVSWSQSRIKWGIPLIERRLVRTIEPEIEIPKSLRESAVKEVMFREYTIPSTKISSITLSKLNDFVGLSMDAKIALTKQMRIVLNSMDPRERVLPIIPNLDASLIPIKHSIAHTNYLVTGFKIEPENKNFLYQESLETFARCLKHESHISRLSKPDLLEIISETWIHESPISNIIKEHNLNETMEIKWLKIVMDLNITNEFTVGNLIISPTQQNCRQIFKENRSGYRSRIIQGTETVSFKSENIRGNFSHSNNILLSITMNYTSYKDFKFTISEVAGYMKWKFVNTTSTNEKSLISEIKKRAFEKPEDVIICTKEDLIAMSKDPNNKTCGILTINNSAEYRADRLVKYGLSRNNEIINLETNIEAKLQISSSGLMELTDTFEVRDTRMLNYFNFKHTLKNRMHNFGLNISKIKEKIANGDFKWKNAYLNKFLRKDFRTVSATCRALLLNMKDKEIENNPNICLLYCFSNHDPFHSEIGPTEFIVKGGFVVNLSGERGVFTYDSTECVYKLFGSRIGVSLPQLKKHEMMNGLLSGFRIGEHDGNRKELVTLRWLEENRDSIQEGKKYDSYICGSIFEITKDSFFVHQIGETTNRQIVEHMSAIHARTNEFVFGKRNYLDDDEPDIAIKRARIEESNLLDDTLNNFSLPDIDIGDDDADFDFGD